MKLRISSSLLLLALTSSALATQAPTESTTVTTRGKLYLGAFGGGGSPSSFNASQFGTIYFPEFLGGAQAINAFGRLNTPSASFFGLQIGYQMPEILLNSSSQWSLEPAAELEGYSTNESSFNGSLVNNDQTRISEHNFTVSYPMSRTIFLANAVINFNNPRLWVHPYVGFGIGNALVRISGASAMQSNPLELGINHYNADASDTDSTFAGQIKLGLNYDINSYVNIFAEYRWLYLASTHFIFGSTINPNHAPTSSWQVNMEAQRYNLGDIGVRIKI